MNMDRLMILVLVLTLMLQTMAAHATPMYAQRSGRTCANCHESPTLESEDGWDNPELMDRKCTMSCISCHVDPTGGGLRNTSGRYYGQSTLGMVHSQDRSYSDHKREVFNNDFLWKVQRFLRNEPVEGSLEGRTIPTDYEEALAGVGGKQTGAFPQAGHVAGDPVLMQFWDGRYGNLNADPVFQMGGDLRAAFYSGTETAFPMQTDLHMAVHPVHHVSVVGTLAGRARTDATLDAPPLFPRRAFILAHELPGMSHAKAGIFMPGYGVYTPDHTAPTRRSFEMDTSGSEDTVIGVEVGTAPNYPFAIASVFANDSSMLTGGVPDQGWGAAVNGGWRDLGWSLTGHAQIRDRNRQGRGDFIAAGVGWGFNPAYYVEALPLTWIGEASVGQRTLGDTQARIAALRSEWSWMLRNGLLLELRSDMMDEDLQLQGGLQHRHAVGLVLTPMPGITFDGQVRTLFAGGAGPQSDVFVQTHFWW